MKINESGMPKEPMWQEFFNIELIFEKLGINNTIGILVDFGSGYGTFSLPAAELVSDKVIAFDIEDEMVNYLKEKAQLHNIKNIEVIKKDFVDLGTGLPDNSVDYVMLFNILHHDRPENLLGEAYRILRQTGKVGIIHWNYDPNTPRGPPIAIRPRPEQLIEKAENVGFVNPNLVDLKPFHYGIVIEKN
jgi:ubiquinone/menaquinone biosynthesis C-methylase UbiE